MGRLSTDPRAHLEARIQNRTEQNQAGALRHRLLSLQHPNLRRWVEQEAGQLALENMSGVPMLEYCSRNRLWLQTRLALFIELCRAVDYCHHSGLAHGAIGKDNVWVDTCGQIKLQGISWGLLRSAADTSFLEPPAPPDCSQDISALGELLYLLITGLPSLDRSNGIDYRTLAPSRAVIALTAPHLVSPPGPSRATLARRLRGNLDSIVLRALSPDPRKQYPSVDELRQDLELHAAALPIKTRGPSMISLTHRTLELDTDQAQKTI